MAESVVTRFAKAFATTERRQVLMQFGLQFPPTPTSNPTKVQTRSPTANPTRIPTTNPTVCPTANPTDHPTGYPTVNPAANITEAPLVPEGNSDSTASPTTNPTANTTETLLLLTPTENTVSGGPSFVIFSVVAAGMFICGVIVATVFHGRTKESQVIDISEIAPGRSKSNVTDAKHRVILVKGVGRYGFDAQDATVGKDAVIRPLSEWKSNSMTQRSSEGEISSKVTDRKLSNELYQEQGETEK